jgi:hypothetical protein
MSSPQERIFTWHNFLNSLIPLTYPAYMPVVI